ncbi:MAG: Hsp20/alpha crystallin family protein [Methanobacterium sp.]|jgi:HSP20 family protein
MKRRDHVLEMKDFITKMMDDTAEVLDSTRKDITTKIVDYTFVPGKDIIETDDDIIVHIALPGIKKEDLKLNVSEKIVEVRAKFDIEADISGTYVTLTDRQTGIVKRDVILPKKVIPDKASAKLENGILRVKIPKLEKTELHTVKIE